MFLAEFFQSFEYFSRLKKIFKFQSEKPMRFDAKICDFKTVFINLNQFSIQDIKKLKQSKLFCIP